MKVCVSWSGGKESCLACHRALKEGFRVTHLLNFISEGSRRCRSHGVDWRLITAQSEAMGIPILQRETTWETYEGEFIRAMKELKGMGVEGGVFGDIYVEEHRAWIERVCGEVGIRPVMPLWGGEPLNLLLEFIGQGFDGLVVSVKADLMGVEWLGRRIDEGFIRDLQRLNETRRVDLCGENGEYHTFVRDGPLFKEPLEIREGVRVFRDGYWFLDLSLK